MAKCQETLRMALTANQMLLQIFAMTDSPDGEKIVLYFINVNNAGHSMPTPTITPMPATPTTVTIVASNAINIYSTITAAFILVLNISSTKRNVHR